MTKVGVWTFGLLLGCFWGAGVLILGIVAMLFDRATKIVGLFSSVYIGYKATWLGSLIGAAWGFVDGMISGMLMAWIYNKFAG